MVISAFLVCLSHGSNDVGNSISPLLLIMDGAGYDDDISFAIGSVGISLGLLLMGVKVMKTVGENIVILDWMKGFCSQFATAICMCIGSSFGVPLSTTHCMIGSLAGVFLAGKTPVMKRVYSSTGDSGKGEESKMNFGTLKKIVFWWVLTIPVALLVAFLIALILLHSSGLRELSISPKVLVILLTCFLIVGVLVTVMNTK